MSIISAGTSTTNALVQTGDTNGNLVFKTNNGTTALTLGTDQSATFAGSVTATGGFVGLPPSSKSWTQFTSSGTYTVPSGVSSIRAYAFGAGGNGAANLVNTRSGGGGGGGGCAYGDIAVTAGQTVTVTISSGVATVAIGATTYLTGNNGANASTTTGGAGGTATKHASVTNGGAYTGGTGGAGATATNNSGGGGGSAASPLGNGYNGGAGAGSASSMCAGGGGGGAGGVGGAGAVNVGVGGGGGGAGGAGALSNAYYGGGGGAGGAAGAYGIGGVGRSLNARFSDPLMVHCQSAGASTRNGGAYGNSAWNVMENAQGPGAGGAGGEYDGGAGHDFGGGAGAGSGSGKGGDGGFGGGGGGSMHDSKPAATGGYGGGGGGYGSYSGGATISGGAGGGAIVLIYA